MSATYFYQIDDHLIDLGDLGCCPCSIEGSVREVRFLGWPGMVHRSTQITKITAYLGALELDVTKLVHAGALTALREMLRSKHEGDVIHDGRGA